MSGTARLAGVGPATRYARSGQVHIAHQVLGSGPPDLVPVPGFVSHVEAAWDWPYLARFLYRLASFGQLVLFDKRGTGLSDPMKRPPTLDERVDDIRAVMDAVGVERAHLFGVSEGGALSIAFAAHYPHRVESLILYGSYPRKVATADYPWGVSRETVARFLGWNVTAAFGGGTVAVRPGSIRLVEDTGTAGIVTARTFRREHFLLDVRLAGLDVEDVVQVEVPVEDPHLPELGARVTLALAPGAAVPLA